MGKAMIQNYLAKRYNTGNVGKEVFMKRRGYLKRALAMGLTAGMLFAGTLEMSMGYVTVQAAITDGKVLVDGLDRSPGYYILPDSSDVELSGDTVASLSDSQRQMAINEIYARHGRKFVIPEVQDYFNEKAWYLGSVSADSFDVNVFSSIEETNIEKLARELHYLLPGSNLRYVTDGEVAALTKEEQQLAVNEIYARRGRKFDMKEYQDYFDSQSWYYGTIAPADFDEGVFNDYEDSNINKLVSAMDNGNYAKGTGDTGPGIYTDFSGEYHLYTQSKEVIVQLDVYGDLSPADASAGTECGTVEISCHYMDGGRSYMNGYFTKDSGNNYVLAGRGMNGITIAVGQDNITLGRSKSINGTYQKE